MTRWILIFLGGGLGSLLRYYFAWQFGLVYDKFPVGTLAANVASSFLLGILMAYYLAEPAKGEHLRLFLMIGFCGGFSTFSTFSGELAVMLKNDQLATAFGYMAISLLLGLTAVFSGIKLYEALG